MIKKNLLILPPKPKKKQCWGRSCLDETFLNHYSPRVSITNSNQSGTFDCSIQNGRKKIGRTRGKEGEEKGGKTQKEEKEKKEKERKKG